MNKVLLERTGAVAVITLNDPATYNALSLDMLGELFVNLSASLADEEVGALLLTGAGKGFCSGANLAGDAFSAGDAVGEFLRQSLNPIINLMRTASKPVVCAVNGPAAGAGVGLALAGDVVVAADSARFVLSFVRLGAALDAGTSWLVQSAVGASRARALALLGDAIDAKTAEEWGLIWKSFDREVLQEEALSLARKLAEGPRVGIGLIKRQIERSGPGTLAQALEDEAQSQAVAFQTYDLREGAAAFVEKRSPKFLGR